MHLHPFNDGAGQVARRHLPAEGGRLPRPQRRGKIAPNPVLPPPLASQTAAAIAEPFAPAISA